MNEQILLKIKQLLKEYASSKKVKKDPQFSEEYLLANELFEKVKPHAYDSYFPKELFAKRAPNESPEEFNYRKELFKAIGSITNPYWEKALAKCNRLWNDKNYYLKINEITGISENDSPEKYLFENLPYFDSIESYFREITTTEKINDPNAVLTVDLVDFADSQLPMPFPIIYPSNRVWDYKADSHLVVKTNEKSVVEYAGRKEEIGIVLRIYTVDGIYRVEQVGKKTDYQFTDPEPIYAFDINYLPAWKLKGRPMTKGEKSVYQSYFMPAVPGLNSAIIDASTLTIGKINSAFPERWEYVDDCDAPGCVDGMVFQDGEHKTCSSCGGTGMKTRSSVMTVRQIPYPKGAEPMGKNTFKNDIQIPPAGYIEKTQVDNMLKFLREEVRQQIVEAFTMINMDVSNTHAKGSETALGKMIDRDEQFTFLMQIAYELFDLYEKTIDAIGALRYGTKWNGLELGKPTNFNIRTDDEITDEIAKAKESGLPSIVIDNLIKQYVNIRFGNIESAQTISDLVIFTDRIYSLSSQEIALRLATNTVANWEVILHDSITSFIEEAILSNPNFMQLSMTEQSNILKSLAQAKATAIAPQRINPEDLLT